MTITVEAAISQAEVHLSQSKIIWLTLTSYVPTEIRESGVSELIVPIQYRALDKVRRAIHEGKPITITVTIPEDEQ